VKRWVLAAAAAVVLLLVATVVWLNVRDEDTVFEGGEPAATPQQIARGAYLARAGDCMTCHTARGGQPYAGGRAIETPFGIVYTSNLTPDKATGIGDWTAGHFWRALHNGRSRDGRLLYPAFPYPNYTRITREDADALFAYLRSLPPVQQADLPNALRFPYNTQVALAVWRALFFRPAEHEGDPARSAEWNRGAYLVQSLGHCNACHATRNALGATSGTLDLSGGLIAVQNWYAPALTLPGQGGVADWDAQEIVKLLKTGVTGNAWVKGPMAEVVLFSTQYLTDADLRAMATYLKAPEREQRHEPPPEALRLRGAKLYHDRCAQCHGDKGEGAVPAYPRLAGNRAVTMDPPANLVRMVLAGGFPPATASNPRPYGMPPFAMVLSNDDVSAVVTYIRTAWGNEGAMVSAFDVQLYRGGLGR
jgi:mono/diheme cytochrome c family protein